MKYLKTYNESNDVTFEVKGGKNVKMWISIDGDRVGYSLVTIKDNVFDNWNLHDDVQVEPIKNTKSLHIIGISIDDRRSGYGSMLINYIEKYAIKMGCDYITLNSITDALGFWKKIGFDVYSMGGYYSMYKKLSIKK